MNTLMKKQEPITLLLFLCPRVGGYNSQIQMLLDVCNQLRAGTAHLLAACPGNAGQILAHLHITQIQILGHSGCGNMFYAVRQGSQIIQIDRQPEQQLF